jgi:hypothetical protein
LIAINSSLWIRPPAVVYRKPSCYVRRFGWRHFITSVEKIVGHETVIHWRGRKPVCLWKQTKIAEKTAQKNC